MIYHVNALVVPLFTNGNMPDPPGSGSTLVLTSSVTIVALKTSVSDKSTVKLFAADLITLGRLSVKQIVPCRYLRD